MTNWDKSSRSVYVAQVSNLRYDCSFVSTNDDYVWKDTPDQKSVNAAFYGKEDMASTIPYKYVQNIKWTTVEIISGFQARIKDKPNDIKYGETPSEAVEYLDFDNTYKIERDPITESDDISKQIKDILRYLTGSVHYTSINNYTNNNKLKQEYTNDDIKNKLQDISQTGNVYMTSENDEWWSIR